MTGRMLWFWMGVVVWGIGGASGVAAQSSVGGVVVSRGDSARPVRDVELTIDEPDRVTRTDALGRFRLADVPPGRHYLRARRLGFESLLQQVVVVEGRELTVRIVLRPSAQPMATMQIAGKAITYPARIAEPYGRVSRAWGHSFTREQIDSLFPLDLQSLLMRVPGVHVKDSKSLEFVRSRVEGHVQVWVDGTRAWSSSPSVRQTAHRGIGADKERWRHYSQ